MVSEDKNAENDPYKEAVRGKIKLKKGNNLFKKKVSCNLIISITFLNTLEVVCIF